jgi:hypothetical protein
MPSAAYLKRKAYYQEYWKKNRERILAKVKGKKRTPKQLEYHRHYMSEYRKTHDEYRERVNHGRCERQKLNREQTSLRWNGWRMKNAQKINARTRAIHREKRLQVLNLLGGNCECCGESQYEFMAIDHRFGDGAAHRKSMKGKNSSLNGINFFNRILKEIKDKTDGNRYRILCHNCNSAIGWYGHCPHEKTTLEIISGIAC